MHHTGCSGAQKKFIGFAKCDPLAMAPKPLEILKRGLAKFSTKIKDHKNALGAKLSQKETISLADEHWLDHEANTMDKQHIIDNLEAASDYESRLARLDDTGRAIVKKLWEWAGDLAQVAGSKQKCMYMHNLHASGSSLTVYC